MHGQWPTEHLAIANWHTEAPRPAVEGLPALTQVLRCAGYFLAHVGKWHVHPRAGPAAYGFHEHVPGREAYAAWRAAAGLPPVPRTQGWFGEIDPYIAPEETQVAWEAGRVIRLLDTYAAQDAPFYLQWELDPPHLPNVVPQPFYSMYPPGEIPPWPSFPDPLIGKPYAQAQQRRTWQVEGWTWADWAPIVSRYLGEIALIDTQIGRVLDELERLSLAGDTVVIYTTDHGDLCGGHGMVDKHMVLYDDVTRVPLIVRWPGRAIPGATCAAFVSHAIDLAITLCQVAGAPVPATFRGQGLLPLLAGESGNGRQDIFCTYHGNQFGLYSERMVRDRRCKYVWNASAEDELYDLGADPGEVHNLATDPAYAGELARLRRRLVTWMEDTRDPLLNAWTRSQLLDGRSI
jgi:arylsulfatase A-like enzyme